MKARTPPPFEELSAGDNDLRKNLIQSTLFIQEKTYKDTPPIMTSEDPALWW